MIFRRKTIPNGITTNALVIADTHGSLNENDFNTFIKDKNIELIILLGDIDISDWNVLLENKIFLNTVKIGILGNHDKTNDINEINRQINNLRINTSSPYYEGIYDLENNNMPFIFKGISFVGLGRSLKYKNDDTLLTQKQALDKLNNYPDAEIIITHDKPCISIDTSDTLCRNAHKGLYAIYKYMKDHNCKYNIHGHIHQNYIKKISKNITEISIYKLGYIQIDKYGIKFLANSL